MQYLGEWYEVESYPDFLEGGSCKRRRYGLTADGLITLQSSYVSNQSLIAVEGSGIFVSTDGSGRLFATYNIAGPDGKLNELISIDDGPMMAGLVVNQLTMLGIPGTNPETNIWNFMYLYIS